VSEGTDDSARFARSSSIREGLEGSQTSNDKASGLEAETKQDQNQNQEQDPEESVEWHWSVQKLSKLWHKRTGRALNAEEYTLATDLCKKHGWNVVEAVLDITLNYRTKSAKMMWKRFKVFYDNWQTNYDLCLAHNAEQKIKRGYGRDIPVKFDCSKLKDDNEWLTMKDFFQTHCKLYDWKLTPEDKAAWGYSDDHLVGAVRFCCENNVKVSKQQFIDLCVEAIALIDLTEELHPVGKGFDVEEA
jgi:hypothetical protein